ncbi:MAG: hypothetical protein VYE67_09975, partial [Planctomycetota bacterium]|nr:hypothetical protein [Planctomycetota bacterium]
QRPTRQDVTGPRPPDSAVVQAEGLKNEPLERQPSEPVAINRPLIAMSRVQFHKEYGVYKEYGF